MKECNGPAGGENRDKKTLSEAAHQTSASLINSTGGTAQTALCYLRIAAGNRCSPNVSHVDVSRMPGQGHKGFNVGSTRYGVPNFMY